MGMEKEGMLIQKDDKEIKELTEDIERMEFFRTRHKHMPRVVKAINKLIYALIVKRNRLKRGYDEFN